MALFNESDLREIGISNKNRRFSNKSAKTILTENNVFNEYKTYDIFLSHSFLDAEVILGLKTTLEEKGYSVYVDWIEDEQLNREHVNVNTARQLRNRMKNCKSLLFATSDNSSSSKWMPWELGFFDGWKNKVAIIPIKKRSYDNDKFKGQEYLGLYSYVSGGLSSSLYIEHLNGLKTLFKDWLNE